MKTLVIGGTGMVGNLVVAGLRKQGATVRVMSHSPEKLEKLPAEIEGIRADLDDPRSLAAAFNRIDDVFLLCAVGPNETDEGLLAVSAAKAAGVKKIVYLSIFMPQGSVIIPHFRSKLPVENAIRESKIAYIILRPNNFFQNDLWLKNSIMQYSIYPQPIGGRGVNRVDVRDVADCAINALMKSGYEGQTYEVHGPDTLTGEAIAGIYTKHLGREVRYSGDDLDAWAARVKSTMPGLPAADMRVMYHFFHDRRMIFVEEELLKMHKLLGHKPRSFDDFVKEITSEWRREKLKAVRESITDVAAMHSGCAQKRYTSARCRSEAGSWRAHTVLSGATKRR